MSDKTLPVAFVAGYGIAEELGRGAFGVVYAGWNKALGRRVAVKVWLPGSEPGAAERAVREAKYLAKLSHPNVVKVYDAGVIESQPFVVMELLEGGSLGARLDAGPLTLAEALRIGVACFDALAACHAANVVHRDLKPANILFGADGEPRLADFGVALHPDAEKARLTETGYLMGTPYYMAPEMMTGHGATARSDLYAMGLVLYEMIAGRAPYLATRMDKFLAERLAGPPMALDAVVQGVPPALVSLLNRLCAPSPDDRPESAAAVVRELAAISVPKAPRVKTEAAPKPAPRARPLPWGIAALSVSSFALGLALGVARAPRVERAAPVEPPLTRATPAPPPRATPAAPSPQRLERARFLLSTNHPDQALQELTGDTSAAAAVLRGHVLVALLRGADAEQAYRDALATGGAPLLEARLGLARALISRGALGEAGQVLDEALKLAVGERALADRVDVLVTQGELARIERRWTDAERRFAEALAAAARLGEDQRAGRRLWIMHVGTWREAGLSELANRGQPPQAVEHGAIDLITR